MFPYFAGLFDAEGYISLCPKGSFTIAIEMANEEIPNLFKKTFVGAIYTRKRDKRKKTWVWKLNSNASEVISFIDQISSFSIVKVHQLIRLREYLYQPKLFRRSTRFAACSTIRAFKQPSSFSKEQLIQSKKPIEPHFFEWLAGFIDGDGNIVCNEYTDKRNNQKYFAHQISAGNIFPEALCHINDRIPGTITTWAACKNPMYKWVCRRDIEKSVSESILPFLKLKNKQCALFLEFIKYPPKERSIPYPIETRDKMYSIINQIKHLNSL